MLISLLLSVAEVLEDLPLTPTLVEKTKPDLFNPFIIFLYLSSKKSHVVTKVLHRIIKKTVDQPLNTHLNGLYIL
jgi:hypothetical protein